MADLCLGLRPEPARATTLCASQLRDQSPITKGFTPEGAFSHSVCRNEGFDVGKDGLLCHGQHLSRVITRMSTPEMGFYTILRGETRRPIQYRMENEVGIDINRLKSDMAAEVDRTSARKFSLAATGGRNPDFYRNFVNNGQDKRLTAQVYFGIVLALRRDPLDYVTGWSEPVEPQPSEAEMTAALTLLLASREIDPNAGGLAQGIAQRLPPMLRYLRGLATSEESDVLEYPDGAVARRDEDQLKV